MPMRLPKALRPEGSGKSDRMQTRDFEIAKFPSMSHWRGEESNQFDLTNEILKFRETQIAVGTDLYENVGRGDITDIIQEAKSWDNVELEDGQTLGAKQRVWLAMAVWAGYADSGVSDCLPFKSWEHVGRYIAHPSEALFVWSTYGTLNERWKLAGALWKPSTRIPEKTCMDEVLFILREGSPVTQPNFVLEQAPQERPRAALVVATEDASLVTRSAILQGSGAGNAVAVRVYEFMLMKLSLIQLAESLPRRVRESCGWLKKMMLGGGGQDDPTGTNDGAPGGHAVANEDNRRQTSRPRPRSTSRARARSTSRPARKKSKYTDEGGLGYYTESGCTYYYPNYTWQNQWGPHGQYDWAAMAQHDAAMAAGYYAVCTSLAWAASCDTGDWSASPGLARTSYGGGSSSSAPPGLAPPPGLEQPAYRPSSAAYDMMFQ